MTGSVLLVDDDPDLLASVGRFLERMDWSVRTAATGEDGLRRFEAERPDVVLLDLVLPGVSGLDVLDLLVDQGATVVLLTGRQEVTVAVEAMRRGAENFLTKPVELPHLEAAILGALKTDRLKRANEELSARLAERDGTEWAGRSRAMRAFAHHAALLARSDSTILLTGESGTGKGWLAERLHELSPRRDEPFVQVNCAGLSATFLETELFGHERGAFTDARQMKRGLFEIAHGGTLFLDEVGDLAPELQPKLLNVLEDPSFRRLGGTQQIRVDVRLIAATNRDLDEAVRDGRFRTDLYHRLNVLALTLPPLRERAEEDRLELIQRMLSELAGPRTPRLRPRTLDLLLSYPWPGNVRELRNVLERALVLAGDGEVGPEHLRDEVRGGGGPAASRTSLAGRSAAAGFPPATTGATVAGATGSAVRSLEEVERQHIARALEALGGNRSRTARVLGISRTTLYKKLEEYGLE